MKCDEAPGGRGSFQVRNSGDVMNCDEVKILLAGLADGELSPIEHDAVTSHVEQCGRCRQVVRDQQRVHDVLDAYRPPPVTDAAWNDMSRILKAELAGKADPAELKTRARVEGLDPTPAAQAALRADEARAAARRDATPTPRPRLMTHIANRPTLAILVPRPSKRRAPFGWVAHALGAVAAGLVIAIGLFTATSGPAAPVLDPSTLARQSDVVIMEVQVMAPDYSIALYTGDADDAATIWIVPNDDNVEG
jgi:hypothetical protein